jgi:hypothetical protein
MPNGYCWIGFSLWCVFARNSSTTETQRTQRFTEKSVRNGKVVQIYSSLSATSGLTLLARLAGR